VTITIAGYPPLTISGVALRIRPEDETLVADLRAKAIPETEIADILRTRQAPDSATNIAE